MIPSVIQHNIEGFLDKILGSMSDSVSFHRVLIIDLDEYFRDNSEAFNRGWIVPKYDLSFVLRDKSMGFINYNIEIRMDEYGQILYSNYPRTKHSDKGIFPQRSEVERIALQHAEDYNYVVNGYYVELTMVDEMLCWRFYFPSRFDKTGREFNVVIVSWLDLEVIDEHIAVKLTVH
jgi:hypothetical protein